MTQQRFTHALAVFAMLCFLGSPSKAADTRQVEARAVQRTIAEQEPKIRTAEVQLRDGSMIRGSYGDAETGGLRLSVKQTTGVTQNRVIAYEQISRIRLDLGPSRTWRIIGGIVGAFVGLGVAGYASGESSDATFKAATISGLAGGGYLGTKLGGRHRKWLAIEVR
jgi:hypothetical protein